jgi:hypothetical protein
LQILQISNRFRQLRQLIAVETEPAKNIRQMPSVKFSQPLQVFESSNIFRQCRQLVVAQTKPAKPTSKNFATLMHQLTMSLCRNLFASSLQSSVPVAATSNPCCPKAPAKKTMRKNKPKKTSKNLSVRVWSVHEICVLGRTRTAKNPLSEPLESKKHKTEKHVWKQQLARIVAKNYIPPSRSRTCVCSARNKKRRQTKKKKKKKKTLNSVPSRSHLCELGQKTTFQTQQPHLLVKHCSLMNR